MFRRRTPLWCRGCPSTTTWASLLGICSARCCAGRPAVLMSPVSFLQKPARWMQLLASNGRSFYGGAELRVRIGGAPDVG